MWGRWGASERALGPSKDHVEVPWRPGCRQRSSRELPRELRGRLGGPKGSSGGCLGPQGGAWGVRRRFQHFNFANLCPGLMLFLRKYSVFHISQNRCPRSSREARGGPGEVLGGPRGLLGSPWGSLGGSLRVLGKLLGSLGGPWGGPGGPKGSLREPRGGPFGARGSPFGALGAS